MTFVLFVKWIFADNDIMRSGNLELKTRPTVRLTIVLVSREREIEGASVWEGGRERAVS